MGDKFKEGISMQELENFARKYTNEVFMIGALLLAALSSMLSLFTGPSWSIGALVLAFILCVAFPERFIKYQRKLLSLALKEDKTTKYIVGGIRLALGLFLPFVLFAEAGMLAGSAYHTLVKTEAPKE
jgi:O-antigen/teichoic acid export membrane protein